jgi:hypothetical protein
MKLRRVMRLPARLAVLSKRWSKDMSVDLHWLVERTVGRGGPGRRVGYQLVGLGQHLLDVVEGIDAPDTMTMPDPSVTMAQGAPGTLAAKLAVSAM